jgi:hypothetical protein
MESVPTKSRGGLGVRDISLANISLLGKWSWRLHYNEASMWKEVLEDKYGPLVSSRIRLEGEVWPSLASRWWKDVVSLEDEGGEMV